jgi:hypothetical protein
MSKNIYTHGKITDQMKIWYDERKKNIQKDFHFLCSKGIEKKVIFKVLKLKYGVSKVTIRRNINMTDVKKIHVECSEIQKMLEWIQ